MHAYGLGIQLPCIRETINCIHSHNVVYYLHIPRLLIPSQCVALLFVYIHIHNFAEFGRSPPSSPLKEFEAPEGEGESNDEAVLEYCNAAGDYQQGLSTIND